MKTLVSPTTKRPARSSTARAFGWLAAALMVAIAAFGPGASPSLAGNGNGRGNGNGNPSSQGGGGPSGPSGSTGGGAGDSACNNILHGAASPDFVWISADPDGVTVSWSQADDKFGTEGEMVVRACLIVEGAELGAISQNTANDGSESFGWSTFGLSADPCVTAPVEVAGSVDGGAPFIETKKTGSIVCSHPVEQTTPPADEQTPPPTEEPTTPPADEQTTPPADEPATPPADEQTPPPTEESVTPPADEQTTPPADEQTPPPADEQVEQLTNAAPVAPRVDEPQAPAVVIVTAQLPMPSVAPSPAGGVAGAISNPVTNGPSITLPPTDTIAPVPVAPSSAPSWRLILFGLATLIVSLLLLPSDRTFGRRS